MNSNPSINPADNGSLAGSIKFAFEKMMQQKDGMLPAKVINYNRTTNRVQVELLITLITTDNTQVSRPQIASLPVLILGGGDYMISFPLSPGDLGWVSANDRDISLFLQSYAESPPNTGRVKSFSDGLFIPDVMTGYTIDVSDSSSLVIQNKTGAEKITMGSAGIKVQSATEVDVTAPIVTVDASTANVSATTLTITSASPTIVTANLTVTGTVTAAGFIPVP